MNSKLDGKSTRIDSSDEHCEALSDYNNNLQRMSSIVSPISISDSTASSVDIAVQAVRETHREVREWRRQHFQRALDLRNTGFDETDSDASKDERINRWLQNSLRSTEVVSHAFLETARAMPWSIPILGGCSEDFVNFMHEKKMQGKATSWNSACSPITPLRPVLLRESAVAPKTPPLCFRPRAAASSFSPLLNSDDCDV